MGADKRLRGLHMNGETVRDQLAQIWSEVLGVGEVADDVSFFELGGHSLLAIRVMARVQEQFNVDLPLAVLFQHPNLEDFAARVASEAGPRERVIRAPADVAVPTPEEPALGDLLATLDELSDVEAAQLLALIESDRGSGNA